MKFNPAIAFLFLAFAPADAALRNPGLRKLSRGTVLSKTGFPPINGGVKQARSEGVVPRRVQAEMESEESDEESMSMSVSEDSVDETEEEEAAEEACEELCEIALVACIEAAQAQCGTAQDCFITASNTCTEAEDTCSDACEPTTTTTTP